MRKIAVFSVMMLFFVTGCAKVNLSAIGEDNDAAVRERVNAFWTAKKENRLGDAYQFYCESFKQKKSESDFIKSSNLNINNYSIVSIDPVDKSELANVIVAFDSNVFGFDMKSIQVKEIWIKKGRQWYVCPSSPDAKGMFQ